MLSIPWGFSGLLVLTTVLALGVFRLVELSCSGHACCCEGWLCLWVCAWGHGRGAFTSSFVKPMTLNTFRAANLWGTPSPGQGMFKTQFLNFSFLGLAKFRASVS